MTKFQKTITTGVAGAAMLLQTAMPVFAATDLVISGNGSDTNNDIQLTQTNNTNVTQDNTTSVENKVVVNADTGNNTADDNVGGQIRIETGDADVEVDIENLLNSNVANLESCGSCLEDVNVLLDGNGTGSKNNADLVNRNNTELLQNNVADIDNDVTVDADTGTNRAEDNTGADVVIVTGDVDIAVAAVTVANTNTASVGPSSGSGGDVDVRIIGNGSDSNNDVGLTLAKNLKVDQYNDTAIDNKFDVEGNSGDNRAEDNTSGEVGIGTGDVDIMASVWNEAGFNYFDDGDCCFDDIFAKIGENGTESKSDIIATLRNTDDTMQTNLCGDKACFDNDLTLDGFTGENKADDNTGDADSDPVILTGDADVDAEIVNQGGSNVMGETLGSSQGVSVSQGPLTVGIDVSALLDALAGLGITIS